MKSPTNRSQVKYRGRQNGLSGAGNIVCLIKECYLRVVGWAPASSPQLIRDSLLMLFRYIRPSFPRMGCSSLSVPVRSLSWYSNGKGRRSPTNQPGFLMYDSVEELKPALSHKSSTGNPLHQHYKHLLGLTAPPSESILSPIIELAKPKSPSELKSAVQMFQNQETASPLTFIKRASRSRHHHLLEMLMQSAAAAASKAAKVESIQVIEDDGDAIELSPDDLAGTRSPTNGIQDHIRCANVLKKRRAKMRRHKHKKRLKENRYKSKK